MKSISIESGALEIKGEVSQEGGQGYKGQSCKEIDLR